MYFKIKSKASLFLFNAIIGLPSFPLKFYFLKYLFLLGLRRLYVPKTSGSKVIWLLSKDGVLSDVDSTFRDSEKYSIYSVSRGYFKALARQYLPLHLDDNSYCSENNPSIQECKIKYYFISKWYWPRLCRKKIWVSKSYYNSR